MSGHHPPSSLSVDSRKLRTRVTRLLSPESEDDVEESLQSENGSPADVPPSPEDEDEEDIDMDADSASDGKCSFGLVPRSPDSFGMESPPGSPLPKNTAPQEDVGESVTRPVEAETLVGDPTVSQEDVGPDVPPSAEAEDLEGSSAVPTWIWGRRAPSPAEMDVPLHAETEGHGRYLVAGAWRDAALSSAGDVEIEENQMRLNLVGPRVDMPQLQGLTAAAIYRAEQVRLQRIHYQIQIIYREGIRLTEIVDAMIEELEAEAWDVIQNMHGTVNA